MLFRSGVSGFGSQGFGSSLLRGFALLSSCFGFLLARDGIDSSAEKACGTRVAVEVVEVAEEARIIMLDGVAIFGRNVVSVAIRTVDRGWFESGLVRGSDR